MSMIHQLIPSLFIVRSVQYWKAGNGPAGDEAIITHCVHVVECQVLCELVERCGVGLSLRLLLLMTFYALHAVLHTACSIETRTLGMILEMRE